MPRRSKVYRGLEYLPVDTCADSAALRFEKARVLGGASMGTRPRRIEAAAAGALHRYPNDHLKFNIIQASSTKHYFYYLLQSVEWVQNMALGS